MAALIAPEVFAVIASVSLGDAIGVIVGGLVLIIFFPAVVGMALGRLLTLVIRPHVEPVVPPGAATRTPSPEEPEPPRRPELPQQAGTLNPERRQHQGGSRRKRRRR